MILTMAEATAALALTALLFVLSQHGWANTLKTIGTAFLKAGTKHERRLAARRRKVQADMVQALEDAGQRA
jgi:hypothetical protein